ncbi:MAG: hypothetical protein Q8M09_13120 [Pseudomonadota bacterium]|nr:hypothetical protein [Pseudomonadota bacterium]MDP1905168.1 hypothetical protein [Pseudomonadota bacterium]
MNTPAQLQALIDEAHKNAVPRLRDCEAWADAPATCPVSRFIAREAGETASLLRALLATSDYDGIRFYWVLAQGQHGVLASARRQLLGLA